MTDIAAWLQVVLGFVGIYLALRCPYHTRRKSRRVVTRWKGFGIEFSRRTDDTDDQGLPPAFHSPYQ